MTDAAASSSRRRMEAVRRHLLPRPPPVLSLNQLSAAEAGQRPVIIGGMVLDIHAKPSVPPHPGTTVPGMVKYIGGGVARNIAECMAKLGTQPHMISVIGDDMAGDFLLKYWRLAGLCTDGGKYDFTWMCLPLRSTVLSRVNRGNPEMEWCRNIKSQLGDARKIWLGNTGPISRRCAEANREVLGSAGQG